MERSTTCLNLFEHTDSGSGIISGDVLDDGLQVAFCDGGKRYLVYPK